MENGLPFQCFIQDPGVCRHPVAVGRVRTTASLCHCTKRITIRTLANKDLKVTTAKW